ncbi:MAG: Fis family transcriptional regulator [Geobacteraceae bacterium GWC2_58_44]|nr:MAG: Fis family transcriptional regulator [Geobacteraceae bacterium GWC2_58_44]HBG04099.1 Fis family transcriptional regulator [Geobacter sp.]
MGIVDQEQQPSQKVPDQRRRGEKQPPMAGPDSVASRLQQETLRLLHELQVHQIELESQNDELRRSREELELSRDAYAELYDFAPVGYVSLDAQGVIREANLAVANLLGIDRGALIGKPFAGLIADAAGRELFARHVEAVRQRAGMQSCEIRLAGKECTEIHGQLQSVALARENGTGYILTSIVDGTLRNRMEETLQNAHDKLEGTIAERTGDLTRANLALTREIQERRQAEESLKNSYAEIKSLKDRLQAENVYLQKEIARQHEFGGIIGESNALSYVFFRVEQVAPLDATVLLLGETGTGKGVIARAIHDASARRERSMITVSCTALPANLIESELFGREKGAYTGSDARQIGRFELADGGTIFLDEIGEVPVELQAKLLRVIQDGEFERLGSPRTIKVDVRIIAATNRNLEQEIREGRFREDLFYRLNVFPITMPPLRQRKEDIPLLVNHFIAKFNKKIGKRIETVSRETLKLLEQYHWPGNVRELESVIERAVILSRGTALQVLDRFDSFPKTGGEPGQEVRILAELEHDHILQVLQKTSWRVEGKSGAAVLLGMNPSTLRARMRKSGISRK